MTKKDPDGNRWRNLYRYWHLSTPDVTEQAKTSGPWCRFCREHKPFEHECTGFEELGRQRVTFSTDEFDGIKIDPGVEQKIDEINKKLTVLLAHLGIKYE